MAIAIQEMAGLRPETLTVGTQLRVKIEYPGEIRDPKTGVKQPGRVTDKFHVEITGNTEQLDPESGVMRRAFVLSDRVHEMVVPVDDIYRGRHGVMFFEEAITAPKTEAAKPGSKTERQMRLAIGLPSRKPRRIPV